MSVKKSVFGSWAERRGFRALEHQWGDKYSLWPGLPFFAIFEPDDTVRRGNFLFTTSIDYTLCDIENDAPKVAIDFDGMGGGFSRQGSYVGVRKTRDPHRQLKFDTKLRYAERHRFPYFVVGSNEMESVRRDTCLSVVDAIIGRVFMRNDIGPKVEEYLRESAQEYDEVPPALRNEYIQDLVIGAGASAEFEHNPFVRERWELEDRLAKAGGQVTGKGFTFVEEPEAAHFDLSSSGEAGSVERFRARLQALEGATRVGQICTLETTVGEISTVAWIRNVGDWSLAMLIARDVAEVLALEKALRQVEHPESMKR